MRLIMRRRFEDLYSATCPRCGIVYLVRGSKREGCADFVDVICTADGEVIGRIREDIGGDKLLSAGDAMRQGELENAAV
jgi:hypothetical protein